MAIQGVSRTLLTSLILLGVNYADRRADDSLYCGLYSGTHSLHAARRLFYYQLGMANVGVRMSKIPPHIMCTGEGCDVKSVCHRHTAKPGPDQQYYAKPPFVEVRNPGRNRMGATSWCEGLWVLYPQRMEWGQLSIQLKKAERKERRNGRHSNNG